MKLFCTAERSNHLHDPHREPTNLCNWRKEAWKKFRPLTGFEPVTSANTGARLYQLIYEATHWEPGEKKSARKQICASLPVFARRRFFFSRDGLSWKRRTARSVPPARSIHILFGTHRLRTPALIGQQDKEYLVHISLTVYLNIFATCLLSVAVF